MVRSSRASPAGRDTTPTGAPKRARPTCRPLLTNCSQEILIGVLVGGGGTIAATEGADVDPPAATILRIRIDQPLEIVVGE